MKKILSLSLVSLLLLGACQSEDPIQVPTDTEENNGEELSIVSTFYPIYFFTSEILGDVDSVEHINLIPSGAEPHTYEPSPSQLAQMESSDLILAQGAGLEPWLEGLEGELESNGVHVFEINEHLDLLSFDDEHEDEDDHDDEDDHEDEDDHGHGEFDPHTWLDPVLAIEMVEHILEELIELDPENETLYATNAEALTSELSTMHISFEAALASCSLDAFITSHDAFNYLANRYELHALSVSGVSPFDEPSAKQLTELIELAESEGIEHIFFEVLANGEAAKVLADEAGLSPLVLNPIAGLSDDQLNEDYLSLMEANLENLTTGLACE